jgi:hypothetical protein
MDIIKHQIEICAKFNSDILPSNSNDKVGIALNTIKLLPLNALRIKPENGTCGWYIWGGENLSSDVEFFQPLHVAHLDKYTPELIPYLSLGIGWRVLLAPNYEDVWFDNLLLS